MASNIVWTNHLQERLAQRGVSRNEAYDTLRSPDKSIRISSEKWKLIKTFSSKQVTIVAVNKDNQWIIITAWSRGGAQRGRQNSGELAVSRFVRSLIIKLVAGIQNLLFKR